ncbi:hypothetical protein D3227_33485 [Mesorhizobium waimense]|uniref:GNAT family N-acetyltransferase n=1 Tax=Mesorhizobium waimense TaxID=1300307 RepID=A0A3A5K0B5_9HYPH|nr:hypothetical protein [Mesorhizobium waimense]RJT28747.1 hypothetical protein D3227_33485 [Mesorhizobium waimense]
MFRLYERHYDAADRDRFERDLAEKNAVVLVRSGTGEIIGFSTILVGRQEVDGTEVNYLFSGDTVLDASRWGDPVLLQAWFRAAGAVKAGLGNGQLFWFPIIKGHRTYRILPNFFRDYFPAADADAAPGLLRIRDGIATARYGQHFDPATGLIDFGESQGHLREQWADAEHRARHNRHADFFLKANPSYYRGVELACIAEFDLPNLKRYGATSFAEGMANGW